MAEVVKSDRSKQIEIPVSGMHCASCVAKVEGIIKAVPGVSAVSVNLATNSATLTKSSSGFDLRAVVDSLNKGGYPANTHRDSPDHLRHALRLLRRQY